MRIATWNMKQVAPRKPIEERWRWIEESINPDVIVLTEATIPKSGLPDGWTAIWTEGGVGPNRRWGTIIAARNVEILPVDGVRHLLRWHPVNFSWPAVGQVAEVVVNGTTWGTVIGLYGITMDLDGRSVGHGSISVPQLLHEAAPFIKTSENVIVAGDFNIWPSHKPRELDRLGLVDLVELTAESRPALEGCKGCQMGTNCGHMWTHRNGNGPNAAVQNLDYIFSSRGLSENVGSVLGGIRDFPDAWDFSDHAPIVVEIG